MTFINAFRATPTLDKCGPNTAGPSLRAYSRVPAPRWYTMRHPIIDLISYSILISWAVFWGMVVGGMFEQEVLRPRTESVHKRPPDPYRSPSPDVFRGVV